jgi:hypothetical protein
MNSTPEIVNAIVYLNPSKVLVLSVTTIAPGTANFVFVLKDNGGILNGGVDSVRTIFSFTVQNAVGINSVTSGEITLYPNPADDFITLTLNNEHPEKVIITDVFGRMVKIQSFEGEYKQCKVSISDLQSGLYAITVYSDKQVYSLKFIRR